MFDFFEGLVKKETTLEAVDYKDHASAAVVINTSVLPKYLYIHLPKECVHLDLISVQDIKDFSDSDTDEETWLASIDIEKYQHHPWVRIKSSLLDWAPGKHLYKMSFGMPHEVDSERIDFFISYISQEDSPEKSYAYMNR